MEQGEKSADHQSDDKSSENQDCQLQILCQSIQQSSKHFAQNQKSQCAGCTRGKVKGSPWSVGSHWVRGGRSSGQAGSRTRFPNRDRTANATTRFSSPDLNPGSSLCVATALITVPLTTAENVELEAILSCCGRACSSTTTCREKTG